VREISYNAINLTEAELIPLGIKLDISQYLGKERLTLAPIFCHFFFFSHKNTDFSKELI
jgi:hypothetical protein